VIQIHASMFLEHQILVFIFDRQKGLLEAVEKVFRGSPHGYCLCHLYKNLHKSFKYKDLRSLLWEAAQTVSVEAFNKALSKMYALCPPAVDWLLSHANSEYWCEFYFPGHRYGHLTSNIVVSQCMAS
jgi:zinc finger SWIM domain-containing protein 3